MAGAAPARCSRDVRWNDGEAIRTAASAALDDLRTRRKRRPTPRVVSTPWCCPLTPAAPHSRPAAARPPTRGGGHPPNHFVISKNLSKILSKNLSKIPVGARLAVRVAPYAEVIRWNSALGLPLAGVHPGHHTLFT